jgi:hypothetical protein
MKITVNKTNEKEICITIGNGADITSKPFQITEQEFDPDARIQKQWVAIIKADERYIPILQKIHTHVECRFSDIIEAWDENTSLKILAAQLNDRFKTMLENCDNENS